MKCGRYESVICAFATFLQLSSTRKFTLFNNLLQTFSMKSNIMANYTGAVKTVLYNDPTLEYLSHKHFSVICVNSTVYTSGYHSILPSLHLPYKSIPFDIMLY